MNSELANQTNKAVNDEPENDEPAPKKKRRNFLSFGLRSLLLLLIASAFLINFLRLSKMQRDAVARLNESNAQLMYQHEMNDQFDFVAENWEPFKPPLEEQSGVRTKLRDQLGSHMVDRVSFVSMMNRPKSKRIDEDAWLAIRSLNYVNPLEGAKVEVNSDAQVDTISGFEGLKLNSYFSGDLKELSRLQDVRYLELAIRAPEVDWIADMPKVKRLKIRKILPAPAFAIDVEFLERAQQIERLEIRALALTNEGSISQLRELRHLSLIHTESETAAAASGLENLLTLDLSNSLIRAPVIANKKLRTLNLADSPVSDLSGISPGPALELVDLRKTLVSDEQVEKFQQRLDEAGCQCVIISGGVWKIENEAVEYKPARQATAEEINAIRELLRSVQESEKAGR